MQQEQKSFDAILDTLKMCVAALRDAEVPFLLGGSLAAWARGAPQSYKDLDLMVRPEDAERALVTLSAAGMRIERPPEEWLYKVWCGEVLVDIIFRPSGLELDDDVFARADTISVTAVSTPVMALEDILVTKLIALSEHELTYTQLIGIARALREQIDWADHPRARGVTLSAAAGERSPWLASECGRVVGEREDPRCHPGSDHR